eukprot:TRINITY_DN3863_c0_g1_i1.p1 TRINITY_DN3863_c0_g1~~TRINITY_DN3863_c0_g1_i1.p1  ORF type:complete len:218 (-),score=35.86 TRINITY_DN3863_c0_g1_i1:77-730(-)
MDDVDRLLAELEDDEGPRGKVAQKPAAVNKTKISAPPPSRAPRVQDDDLEDIDDILKSIDSKDPVPARQMGSFSSLSAPPLSTSRPASGLASARGDSSMPRAPSSSGLSKQKCTHIFLGGPECPEGCCVLSSDRKRCTNLRCTKCDFKVQCLDEQAWTKSVDYLFLRNNFPDVEKLKKNLVKKKGHAAYSCQCSWRTAKDLESISLMSDIKWVCGGH